MEQFKRAKVWLLTSNESPTVYLYTPVLHDLTKNILEIHNSNARLFGGEPIGKNFYITSDDEIKENDWVYTDFYGEKQVNQAFLNNGVLSINITENAETSIVSINKFDRKVISSTDKELGLPQPFQSFITKYIEEYNKGNIITDVLVEYHNNYNLHYYTPPGGIECCEKIDNWQLKINSKDNTITIKKVKDTWNRDEVIKLIQQFHICTDGTKEYEKKWIEENL